MTADPHDPTLDPRPADGPEHLESRLTPGLTELCQRQIEPILLQYFSGKLRSSMRHNDDDRNNQDALELLSEAKMRILRKLCKSGSAVEDVEAYTRVVARNVFHEYLRKKYPRRLSVKNQCRYLLTHHRDLRLWRGENDVYLCGLSTVERDAAYARSIEISSAIVADVHYGGVRKEAATASEVVETVFLILRNVARPVVLDDLVSAVMERLRITDPIETWQTEDTANLPSRSLSAQVDIEGKEFAKRLWSEILCLPVRHRAALLLNFRDENGDDLASSIVTGGAATIRDIAAALAVEADEFAQIWKDLPWDDMRIAEHLGLERQQVINLRQSAKQKLRRKLV